MTRITGPILALDLASRCGYCVGLPTDKPPRSGSVVLKQPGEDRRVALSNMMAWLEREFTERPLPALIVVEAPLSLEALRSMRNSSANVRLQLALHGIVEAMSDRYQVRPPLEANVGTVRRHFLGQANYGRREDTKAAVVRRAQALGYVSKTCTDDNVCDACAVWDYACAHYAGRVPEELVLFESGRARKARSARA